VVGQAADQGAQAAGIKVTGQAGRHRALTDTLIATQRSAPLSTILKRMNKDSDNFFAEMLLKASARTSPAPAPATPAPRSCA